jgi:hypothetical protein
MEMEKLGRDDIRQLFNALLPHITHVMTFLASFAFMRARMDEERYEI